MTVCMVVANNLHHGPLRSRWGAWLRPPTADFGILHSPFCVVNYFMLKSSWVHIPALYAQRCFRKWFVSSEGQGESALRDGVVW